MARFLFVCNVRALCLSSELFLHYCLQKKVGKNFGPLNDACWHFVDCQFERESWLQSTSVDSLNVSHGCSRQPWTVWTWVVAAVDSRGQIERESWLQSTAVDRLNVSRGCSRQPWTVWTWVVAAVDSRGQFCVWLILFGNQGDRRQYTATSQAAVNSVCLEPVNADSVWGSDRPAVSLLQLYVVCLSVSRMEWRMEISRRKDISSKKHATREHALAHVNKL